MSPATAPCCSRCSHSPARPCRDFVRCFTAGPLCHDEPACRDAVRERRQRLERRRVTRPAILVGLGTCGLAAGAGAVFAELASRIHQGRLDVELVATGCIGFCEREPLVDIRRPGWNRILLEQVRKDGVDAVLDLALGRRDDASGALCQMNGEDGLRRWTGVPLYKEVPFFAKQVKIVLENCGHIDPSSIDEYIAAGGYSALDKVLQDIPPEAVVAEVLRSGLRGRGGGGFPTGRKWQFARQAESGKKYLVCNADEGDPGAFMDRSVLESDPHRILEGMLIGGWAIGADEGYIYCRAEYPLAIERLHQAIAQAESYGLLGRNILGSGFHFELHIKKGAGAFVCGEETALLASIEGKRGMPRPRPPFPAQSGLFGQPTVINNVETFANVPAILRRGADWFAGIGTPNSRGTKVFAVTGKIRHTGLVEVPMGMPLREVIFDIAGGIPGGKAYKAVQIGGPSGGCIPAQHLDIPIDYESLKEVGAMMGSGGLVVMDEDTCMVDVARFFMDFIRKESCGKCIPCREGTTRLYEILDLIVKPYRATDAAADLKRFQGIIGMERLAEAIRSTSLCGLGMTAPNPVLSTLRFFRDEYEAHIYDRQCPSKACRGLLTYRIDTAACTGCTACARKCPVQAIVGEKKQAHYVLDDKCVRCDTCRQVCRFDAVRCE
jgi:NADH:ubiquinone oxidoreductase subunit F (NADH-binding)/Pyruvate/2-oxoacid:ferredoxin oxidoreductase delta subunit/(2Fe-2S) ferredoxin